MQKIISFSLIAMFFTFVGCGNSDQNKEDGQDSSGESEEKAINQLAADLVSLTGEGDTLMARFRKFVPGTTGTIYVFEDKSGEEHLFFGARGAQGLDFIDEMQPSSPAPDEYDDKWFSVIYEEAVVAMNESEYERLFITNISETESPLEPAFSPEELKSSSFSGIEPLWTFRFFDGYAKRNAPGREWEYYYLKNGQKGEYKLADVIEPVSSEAVAFEIVDKKQEKKAVITITRQICDDGMSDNKYPFTISVDWENDDKWHGCGQVLD